MEKDLPPADQTRITQAAGGLTLKDLARSLVDALAPDQLARGAGEAAAGRSAADQTLLQPRSSAN